MRIYFSVSGMIEAVRSLYEHDMPAKAAGKKSGPGAPKKPLSGKKEKAVYLESGKNGSDDAEEDSEEYETVFATKEEGEYAIKSGHQGKKLNESSVKSGGLTIHTTHAAEAAKESAQTLSKLYEARAVLSGIGGMLAGADVKDAHYVRELAESTASGTLSLRSAYVPSVVKIEYADPVFINNQWTYQRIFMKNDRSAASIYDFTLNKANSTGLETKVRHDDKFNTVYFESLNGVSDGSNKTYWEVWVNGNIVEEALDKKELKKGDVVEWRLANERETGCGGGYSEEKFVGPEIMSIRKLANPIRPLGSGDGYALGFNLGGYGFR
jgi:hypothetical protein